MSDQVVSSNGAVDIEEVFTQLQKLNRDLLSASRLLGRQEARYLVDNYE